MTRRSYRQYCGLAHALDLVGERWTLLIVRDVAVRPRRFGELLDGLPGLGTSLLSNRLKQLEHDDIIERAVTSEPSGIVYRLTDHGRALAAALAPLTRWGAATLPPAPPSDHWDPDWLAFTITSAFHPEHATDVDHCYRLDTPAATLYALVTNATVTVTTDQSRPPDLTVTTDLPTLAAIGSGTMSITDAATTGHFHTDGPPHIAHTALRLFGLPPTT
ncbi:helix-turn-helix domain-containing protein [Tsukamurella sp. 8F]|uniref:winged helix-turn-helix transcriptional regulator n=1 Tax=unclassified Tsukamurella TaxID=2633480 RepID=UPI0023BA3418|nr:MULTISPECIES: helix-turn-helix domain-containing protein [unclassified Tsukamurella]MDF0531104.1 helix-turn-helix domain-containing protein [Tsukamurella sp. 8J]MDF0588350.1 helix-turn-helix domain-containing protein [Tsukamurella sp. 8F]